MAALNLERGGTAGGFFPQAGTNLTTPSSTLVKRVHSQKKSAEKRTQSQQTSPILVSSEIMLMSPEVMLVSSEVMLMSPEVKQPSPGLKPQSPAFKLPSPLNRFSPPKLLEEEVRPSVLARAGAMMGLFEP